MVSTNPQITSQSSAEDSAAASAQDGADRSKKPLDVIFLQDTTGSQGPYIIAARKAIRDICDKISASGDLSQELIKFGLVAFRDHPPQEKTYVTKNFGFTCDMNTMERNLTNLEASGGGDGPEAQTAALADALNMEWTEDAVKIVILITDSPPHGLGEPGDGFTESPDQNDPLEIARQMAERGITLFVIACEPELSRYQHAVDFYGALTEITSGRVFPLLMADKLGDYIVGTVIETIETEKLIGEFEKVIVNDVYANATPMETVAANLQQFIQARGSKITTMAVEDIYIPSPVAANNAMLWRSAASISDARKKVQPVTTPRIQEQYRPQTIAPTRRSRAPDLGMPSSARPRRRVGLETSSSLDRASDELSELLQRSQQPQPQPQPQQPAVSFDKQEFSHLQAQRIVMQSIARNSKVTSAGMFSKDGQAASSTAPSPLNPSS